MKRRHLVSIAAVTLIAAGTSVYSAKIIRYFSPNNDGVRDVLEVPFTAKDSSRIIAWEMVIENSSGQVIRRIGNKQVLPSNVSAKGFFKQIVAAKTGVVIPEKVVWDGTKDDGTTAEDGEYFYYISVTDENKNIQKTKKFSVTLDNTRPQATVTPPGYESNVFGEGSKVTYPVKQTGSKERLWTGTITDSDGKAVRTLKWEDAVPSDFVWDGTDDSGMIVSDGVYNYSLFSEDRAGNTSLPIDIKNIVFSAEKPMTNISISGAKYFSVPKNSKQSSITLEVKIPEPSKGSPNKLADWSVEILDTDQKVVRTYNPKTLGTKDVPARIQFDGIDDNGRQIPEGEYYATVRARYLNGYQTLPVNTSKFVFDTTIPQGTIAAEDNIFSPDGDGRKETARFTITKGRPSLSPVNNWTARIFSADSKKAVREYNFGAALPESLSWNGIDSAGKLCPDGEYYIVLFAQDAAGNTLEARCPSNFSLDTSKTELALAVSQAGFSPNGDNVQDTVTFTTIVKANKGVDNYQFEIRSSDGKTVYSQKKNGNVPGQFVWNGRNSNGVLCPDGLYTAVLTTNSTNGSQSVIQSEQVRLDSTIPEVKISVPYTVFSADGASKKNVFVVKTTGCSKEELWTAKILDRQNKVIREYTWQGFIGGQKDSSIEWDGTDDSGKIAADGIYSMAIVSQDICGNSFAVTVPSITLDSRPVKVYLTNEYDGISPSSTTGFKSQKFNITSTLNEGIENWQFEVQDEKGTSVYSQTNSAQKTLPKQIIWSPQTSVAQGNYKGILKVIYTKGNEVLETSKNFLCSNTAPLLSVTTSPEFFSPDNDGTDDELDIHLAAKTAGRIENWSFVIKNPQGTGKEDKTFWYVEGTDKITSSLVWNGLSNTSKEKEGIAERVQSAMDYPWEFTVTDSLGLKTTQKGVIHIDILVIRDGNVLKMAVPAIIFRSNAADFKTAKEAAGSKVTPEQAANNERVLKRVASILKKFPDYRVTVVGHANNTTGTEEEETSTAGGNIPLVPLSQKRAEFVKTRLVAYGVKAEKLSVIGMGGRQRIAALEDKENWWKNRRVEFLLEK